MSQVRVEGIHPFYLSEGSLTPLAKQALKEAYGVSQSFQHPYIGTEQILAGLTGVQLFKGDFASVGLPQQKILTAIEFIVGKGDKIPNQEIGLTARASKVINLAGETTIAEGSVFLDVARLFEGIVEEKEGIAAGIIESLGVDLDNFRNRRFYRQIRQIEQRTLPPHQQEVLKQLETLMVALSDRTLPTSTRRHLEHTIQGLSQEVNDLRMSKYI